MMNLKEIKESASALASQFRGHVPMAEAIVIMPTIQPKYAEYWEAVGRSIDAGNPLSSSLHEIWPEALVSAVIAGEEAGKMEAVFTHIAKAIQIQLDLRKLLMKLVYPAVIGVAGVLVFIGIMVLVAPKTARVFRSMEANPITALSMAMESFFLNYWMVVLAGAVGGAVVAYKWAESQEGKETLLELALSVPYVGLGLKDLYFGLWAEYMAMMAAAGITTDRAILLTLPLMPSSLQGGLAAFERDISVNNLPLEDAANVALMRDDDPRREWPLFIRRALILGDRTGVLDQELLRVAPELVEQGVTKVSRAIDFGNVGATVVAGLLVAMSFLAVYAPIVGAIKTFR